MSGARHIFLAMALIVTALPTLAADPTELTFERHIRPILKAHCFPCHGEGDKLEGKLDLRLKRLATQGGESGPAIVVSQPDASLLLQRIENEEMPLSKRKVNKAERDLIRRWIAAGAPTAAPEPDKLDGALITDHELTHWAFHPVRRSVVPAVTRRELIHTPVDHFLLAALQAKGLSFSPEADRRTLIRRATFDLHGIPPTPADVEEFINDLSLDAYERLIERLLASPRYGERWSRHWLDIAGYADSDGYTDEDPVRSWAWKYRDYVLRSFNADKPFDEFLFEQIAGDELVPLPHANLSADNIDKLIATGFLRMAPDGTASGGVDQNIARNAVMSETIKTVATSLFGMTLGCAECHNHRYEPMTQVDYYRFRAIFEPAYDWKNWRAPGARMISLYTDADRQKAAEIEADAAKIDAERQRKLDEHIQRILDRELLKESEELREPLRSAHNTPGDKRTPEQVKLLKEHPNINVNGGTLPLYDNKAAEEVNAFTKQATEARGTKPVEEFVMVLNETPGTIPPTFLFARGEHFAPKQPVEPGELAVLEVGSRQKKVGGEALIPVDDPALPTSGRRLAYARWLTSGRHPLVARVLVNRVWMQHFGRGLVSTPADFGVAGERPSHPELLEWLASEFVASERWSLKHLHRLILLSTAYRQTSAPSPSNPQSANPDLQSLDPDNRWLSHFPLRRLHAEEVRDSLLAISGKLNQKLFGKPVPVMQDEIGQFILGVDNINGNGVPDKLIPLGGEEFRRSLYVQVRRSRPLSVMDPFDLPVLDPNCPQRNSSTVSPQSLLLMNSDFVQEHSRHLAERLVTEAGPDLRSQIILAWRLAFATDPNETDLTEATAFLTAQTELFRSKIAAAPMPPLNNAIAPPLPDPARQSLALLCQALLSSNRFLYVE